MNKVFFLFCLSLFINLKIFPQGRPTWILNPPFPSSGDNTFYYKVATGEDIDINRARISAIATALYEGALKIGLFVSMDQIKDVIQKKGIPGASVDIKLPINIICDYSESLITKRGYKVWVLCQVAERGNITPKFENFDDCYPTKLKVGFNALLRSIAVPGWGQLYKGETFKGISFMTLSLGGLTGGFIFKQLSIDAANKANSSLNHQTTRDFYNQQMKDYDTYSKISFITAAVFYVWNLIDAIAVPYSNLNVNIEQNQNNTVINICYRF